MGPARSGKYRFSPRSLIGLRRTLGITQAQMADLLGVPANTVSRWETSLTVPDAQSLAAIYSVAMEYQVQPNFFQLDAPASPPAKRCTKCGGPRTYSYSSWCRSCQYANKKAKMAEKPKLAEAPNESSKPCTKCGGPRTYAYSSWCKDCQYARKKARRAEEEAR